VKKEALLVEAEALLPQFRSEGADLAAAKRAFRDIAERWDAAGKVPREQIKALEARIRKIEQEIRGLEEAEWRKSDPEKSARADDMVTKLRDAIAKVEKDLDTARSAGDHKKVTELEENLASRRSFLEMAQRASADYSG
jgi:DNA repair exonuclease SbcCD ATPase subunit